MRFVHMVLFLVVSFFSLTATAAEVLTNVVAAPVAPVAAAPSADLLTQVLDLIHNWGGIPWVLKISAILTLVLSSMKVSFLNNLIWSKLGAFKAWAAPVLALIVGVLDLARTGQLTVAGVLAFVSAGAGAIILHELLDTLKALPGLGPMWVELISVVSAFLGGSKQKSA